MLPLCTCIGGNLVGTGMKNCNVAFLLSFSEMEEFNLEVLYHIKVSLFLPLCFQEKAGKKSISWLFPLISFCRKKSMKRQKESRCWDFGCENFFYLISNNFFFSKTEWKEIKASFFFSFFFFHSQVFLNISMAVDADQLILFNWTFSLHHQSYSFFFDHGYSLNGWSCFENLRSWALLLSIELSFILSLLLNCFEEQ